MKKAHKTAAFGILLLTAALILLSGCGTDHGPVAPEMEEVITPLPMPLGMAILGTTTASQEVGRDGGVLQLDFCVLIIPEDALDYDVEISITRDDPDYATVDFGPDGQQFNAPVEMLFEISIFEQFMADEGLTPEELIAALYAEDSGMWEALDTQVKIIEGDEYDQYSASVEPGMYISAKTTHFSRYALSFSRYALID